MPDLVARPGDRVVVDAEDKRLTSEVLARLVGLDQPAVGQVLVNGQDLAAAHPKELRALVGYAAQGLMLVRGTVSRTVRYRSPDAPMAEVDRLLALVELTDRVGGLPDGTGTTLVHGGEPLTIAERARLLLARALLDQPALLVLDHLDVDLGRQGRAMLRRVLSDYPGVVMLASDDPDLVMDPTCVWGPDTVAARSPSGRRHLESLATT